MDPAAFFKLDSTGRVHAVRSTQRITHGPDPGLSIRYWCGNISIDSRGVFLRSRENEPLVCGRCLRDLRRALRVRAAAGLTSRA